MWSQNFKSWELLKKIYGIIWHQDTHPLSLVCTLLCSKPSKSFLFSSFASPLIAILISSLSPGPSVAGTELGRGWYDGTSFAGGKFERGRDLCRREPLSPGTSFAGNLFRRGFWQQWPLSPGISYDGTSFAGDVGGGPLSPGIWVSGPISPGIWLSIWCFAQ